MAASGGEGGAPRRAGAATFELERFAWGSPDRLELIGRFAGLGEPPDGEPVLVVRGAGGRHRLPVAPNAPWPPLEGETWQAAFVWEHPPAPFDAAELELGSELAVDLPRPGSHRRRLGRRALPVRPAAAEAAPPGEDGGEARAAPSVDPHVEEAQREARDAQVAVEAVHVELVRAREELESERRRRDEDAGRFRQALQSMREVAEETVVAEHGELAQLDAKLEAADAKLEPAVLQQLRTELDSVLAARATEQEELRVLRERSASLEAAATSSDDAREERDRALRQVETVRRELDRARRAVEDERRECEQLRARLEAIRLAANEGG
jgi:hypothetical protein